MIARALAALTAIALLGANVPPPPPPLLVGTPAPSAAPSPAASSPSATKPAPAKTPEPKATALQQPVAETATAFLARVKAAQKAIRPASEIETSDVAVQGLTGTSRAVRRGDDFAETTTYGPIVTAQGSIGGKDWHQNENGITVLDEPEPSQSTAPKSETLARVSTPRDAYVVTRTEGDGRVYKTTYDAVDLSELSEEITRGKHYVHITYDDFRPYNGAHRRSWHVKGADDRGNTYETTLESDDVGATVDPAQLAIPPNRRTLVEFPPNVNQVALPAHVDYGRIHVTVDIDGSPFVFVLDSGASGIIVDDAVVKALKLQTYGKSAMTVAGTFASTKAIAPVFRVGPLLMRDVVVTTAPLDEREGPDRVVGLLGFDFIAGAVLRVDYVDPGGVEAIRPSAFQAPPLATAVAPIRLNQQVPVVRVGVGDAFSDDTIVDTGAEAPIIFFDRFVKAHPQAVADEGFAAEYDPAQNVMLGVGGQIPIVPLRLRSFKFADLEFKNYIVLRAAEPGAFGDFRDDGLLGALLLRFYTLYIDYPDRKLYFEPNRHYTDGVGKPFFLP